MKKALTNLFIITILLLINVNIEAQSSHEIGIRFSNLEHFGGIYKKKKSENKYHRIRVLLGKSHLLRFNNENRLDLIAGIAYGVEKRVAINENLKFYHGWEPTINLTLELSERSTFKTNLGLGYVLGMQYNFRKDFYVSLETIPAIRANIIFNGSQDTSSFYEGGFNASSLSLSLVHQFDFKK